MYGSLKSLLLISIAISILIKENTRQMGVAHGAPVLGRYFFNFFNSWLENNRGGIY